MRNPIALYALFFGAWAIVSALVTWVLSRGRIGELVVVLAIGLVLLYLLGILLDLLWKLIVRPLAARLRIIKPTADDFVIRAWEAERDNQNEAALAAYDEVLRDRPWDDDALSRRASLLQRSPELYRQAEASEKKRLLSLTPLEILVHLGWKASDRKLRLVCAACLRSVEHLLKDRRSRTAIEATERYADHRRAEELLSDVEESNAVREAAWRAAFPAEGSESSAAADELADADFPFRPHLQSMATEVVLMTSRAAERDGQKIEIDEQKMLLGCILGFGEYTRQSAPSWLTSTVTALAKQMYESRDFSLMPILGDALQDAGCENADILAHCRNEGPHARGCWVVDLLLGKS